MLTAEQRREQWFWALDNLPPEVRQIVADAPHNFDVTQVLQLWRTMERDGYAPHAALERLREALAPLPPQHFD